LKQTFKATFGTPRTFATDDGYLYAVEKDAHFYTCAEVRIASNDNQSGYSKALTVLQVTMDMQSGVVYCAGLLYSQKKWNDRAMLRADLYVLIEE
jgi:hypothetical protein